MGRIAKRVKTVPRPSNTKPEPFHPEWSKKEKQIHLLRDFKNFACLSGMMDKYEAQPHNEMCDALMNYIPNPFDSGTLEDALERAEWRLPREVFEEVLRKFWTLETRSLLFGTPRDTFKTTLAKCFHAYCLYLFRYVFGIDISTLYMRDSHNIAKSVLEELKSDLTRCSILIELFGSLEDEADIWSGGTINWSGSRDPSVTTAGVTMGRTGTHPLLISCDDLVNDGNYTSPKKMQSAWKAIIQFEGTMSPGSVRIVWGTPFTKNDCYAKIRKMIQEARKAQEDCRQRGDMKGFRDNKPLWDEFIRSAYNRDGSLFFPARLTEALLASKKKALEKGGMGKLFSSWYLMEPTVEGEEVFLSEYKQWGSFVYNATPKPEIRVSEDGILGPPIPVNVYMRVDPAMTGNEQSHKHGICVMATDADFNKYVLFAKGFRMTPSDVTKELCKIIHRFLPPLVIIEAEMADPGMVSRVTEYVKDNKLKVRIDSPKSGLTRMQKALRIRALQPWYYDRTVWWQRGGACEDLQNQYDIWPDIEDGHADVLDAHAGMTEDAKPYTGDALKRREYAYQRQLERMFEEVTEEEEFGHLAANWGQKRLKGITGVR